MKTLDFPQGKPDAYIRLKDEPEFCAAKHLALEAPANVLSLRDLGYDETDIARCPSAVGISTAFRVFSDEGLAIVQELAARMKSNRNEAQGTGKNRLGSYIRGAGYRSQFLRDFCDCPEWLSFVSDVAGTPLARHTVPAVACGVNYAPEDVSRAVDSWHVDSVSFDCVILLTAPELFRGGKFQYFRGTKVEGETLLGGRGEEGTQTELPASRVSDMDFPGAGWGFLQQGNMVFHRACRLLEKAERTTMIPSFVALDAEKDATNVTNMRRWGDPGLLAELARHEAWSAGARLQKIVDELPLDASADEVAAALETAAAGLSRFAAEARTGGE